MIDKLTIEKILNRVNIVEVIQDFISLKRRGANFIGLCPFHGEKTPSFTVSQSKGLYKCFGCGKGGNATNFVMEHEHFSYPEALKYLAKKYGVEVVERELSDDEKKEISERESLNIVNEYAAKYFENTLFNTEEGIAIGLSYFKERGFNQDIIKKFRLGYCLERTGSFTKKALEDGYKALYLEKTGLSIIKENYVADRYSGRVLFPIFGVTGQTIGFGGRTLSSDKKTAKYINSPDSPVYNKSKTLYGLFQAKGEIVRQQKAYLVEGYTDVLSLHQIGIENVVASSGTSLTVEQIRLVHNFTQDVTILYDGDEAGIKASLRGIDMLLEQGLNVRIVLLPEGEDPDSFAKKNSNVSTLEYIKNNEQDFITFKTKLLNESSKNDPILRSKLISEIVRSISVIDDNIKQAVYIKECSNILNISENTLYSETIKLRRKIIEDKKRQDIRKNQITEIHNNIPPVPSYINNIYFENQEHEIIRLLLLYGNKSLSVLTEEDSNNDEQNNNQYTVANFIIDQLRNDNLEMKIILNQKIFILAEEIINRNEDININFFINNPDPEVSKLSASLCSSRHQISPLWTKRGAPIISEDKQLTEILEDVFIKYKLNIVKEAKQNFIKELKIAEKEKDTEKIKELTTKVSEIINIITELSKMQGRVTL